MITQSVLIPLLGLIFLPARCSSSSLKSPLQSSATSFWITVEPKSVSWTKGCLRAAGCDDSRLTLSEWNLVSDERISSSWSIHELFDSSHMFVSYWSKGKPADIMFNYEIVGTDPIYGFTRICDSTRAVRVFDGKQELTTELARTTTKTTRIPFQQTDRITLNLTGKCFHVALIIQNYESDCPWSSCDEGYALVGQLPEAELREVTYQLDGPPEMLVDIGLIALTAIAITTSAAFSCALIAYLRGRRSNFDRNVAKCCNNNSSMCRFHKTEKSQPTKIEINR